MYFGITVDTAAIKVLNDYANMITAIIAMFSFACTAYFMYKGTKIQRYLLLTSLDKSRKCTFESMVVSTTKLQDAMLAHIVIYNMDQTPLLLKSVDLYSISEHKTKIFNILKQPLPAKMELFKNAKKEAVERTTWWPTTDPKNYELKYRDEVYRDLYVDNMKDVIITIPLELLSSETRYKICVVTSAGSNWTSVDFLPGRARCSHKSTTFWPELDV